MRVRAGGSGLVLCLDWPTALDPCRRSTTDVHGVDSLFTHEMDSRSAPSPLGANYVDDLVAWHLVHPSRYVSEGNVSCLENAGLTKLVVLTNINQGGTAVH